MNTCFKCTHVHRLWYTHYGVREIIFEHKPDYVKFTQNISHFYSVDVNLRERKKQTQKVQQK